MQHIVNNSRYFNLYSIFFRCPEYFMHISNLIHVQNYYRDVSEYTGAPEMLGGRVKTLHPAIHAGR